MSIPNVSRHPGQSRRAVVVHQFAEFVALSRLGRSFRWLLASSETPDSWLRSEAEVDRISKTV